MLEKNLYDEICELSKKKILSFERYHNTQQILWERRLKNYQSQAKKKNILRPEHWEKNKMHNPYYVLKNAREIAHSVFIKLLNESYSPRIPFVREIQKNGSKKNRNVNIFQIPDEAVSKLIYKKLLQKNRHRLSSFSYAYRDDRNVHFAIQDISVDIRQTPRIYIAEFDFKDFFGSISQDYIKSQYDKNGFMVSNFEQIIINKFLELEINKIEKNKYLGIPQGTSLSLFIANMICWSLDRDFEKNGLRFARYADDTIIWSDDYSKISKSFSLINEFSKSAGVEINIVKSDGISLLTKKGMKSELASTKKNIEFLGYSISNDNISIKDESVKKIKQHISFILYQTLIQPINKGKWINVDVPNQNEDRSFISAIMQIRRYLYGNLNEKMLRNYVSGSYKRLNFKGIMSFYPLIDDEQQLKELDKWLVSTLSNALKKRGKLLSLKYEKFNNYPLYSLKGKDLVKFTKNTRIGKSNLEVPSFLRIYRAIEEKVVTSGIEATMHPKSNYYNY
ncbi:reverse transcriptase domain-containing protein [Carnobacterium maltaromaticum]|uniref:reverse transcriptase domain-containing protein n=1 Tax=Carnobacterium maltaromaticum TaxID=2751 RepID=UPI00295E2E4A|nr:reverse transcriptase domain-containing protein [Carnobacterium maltaromaticum]